MSSGVLSPRAAGMSVTCLQLTVFCVLLLAFLATASTPVLQTPLGRIQGYTDVALNGRQFYAFTKIPFAVPPVGDLRFKVRYLEQCFRAKRHE